jgi:hypothetical protein
MEVSGQFHDPAALPLGKEYQYPLDRRLSGPQRWSGCRGKEKNHALQLLNAIQPIAYHIPTELPRLLMFIFFIFVLCILLRYLRIYIYNPQSQLFLFRLLPMAPTGHPQVKQMYQHQFCLCENHHAILNTSIITCVTFYIILFIY